MANKIVEINWNTKKFSVQKKKEIEGKKVIDGTNKSLTDKSHSNNYMKYKYTKIIY